MKIAFHSSYLGYRGTEIALMDYAQGNLENLGNQSFFLLPWRDGAEAHPVTRRMKEIAPLRFYRSPEQREGILREEQVDFFYCIKNGFNDGVSSRHVPTGIHAIFRESEFHGDVYAYVSPWLAEVMAYGQAPWVPHMVRLAAEDRGFREEMGVPEDATVFGRHGGEDSFDIPWVHRTVEEIAAKRPDLWFLFLNTREFRGVARLPNVRFLAPTSDLFRKRKFLNSCDAMLHGRIRGETFGLSCLEFAMLGKPVLTYADSPETAHLAILGDRAVHYQNPQELMELLANMNKLDGWKRAGSIGSNKRSPAVHPWSPGGASAALDPRFKDYQPEAVMKKFQEVFLR